MEGQIKRKRSALAVVVAAPEFFVARGPDYLCYGAFRLSAAEAHMDADVMDAAFGSCPRHQWGAAAVAFNNFGRAKGA